MQDDRHPLIEDPARCADLIDRIGTSGAPHAQALRVLDEPAAAAAGAGA